MATTYYFVKPVPKNWKGDDHGAQYAALAADEKAQKIDRTNFKDLKQPATIYAKGTNLAALREALKKAKETDKNFDLSTIKFKLGGNQTQETLETIQTLLDLGVSDKNINAEVLPGAVSRFNLYYYSYLKQVTLHETCAAITGMTKDQLDEKFIDRPTKSVEDNNKAKSEVKSLENLKTQIQEDPFVTIHWGGPIAGETLTDAQHKEHKAFLVERVKAIKKQHRNAKFLFVPHGGRSFKFKEDSEWKTIQNIRKKGCIEALQKAVGEENVLLPMYNASLAFTKERAKDCLKILAPAENFSTIAEQCSLMGENKKPPLEIVLLECCKQNNEYWQSMAKVKEDAWLKDVEITLTNPNEVLPSKKPTSLYTAFGNPLNALSNTAQQQLPALKGAIAVGATAVIAAGAAASQRLPR